MANKYNVQSISFPTKELHKNAKVRANSLSLSLSRYVMLLIKKDLAEGGSFVIEEDPISITKR